MRSDEEVNEIMKTVRQPFRYVFENMRPKNDLTKEEWEAWVERNPNCALTSEEVFPHVEISDKPIGIPREPGATKKPPGYDL